MPTDRRHDNWRNRRKRQAVRLTRGLLFLTVVLLIITGLVFAGTRLFADSPTGESTELPVSSTTTGKITPSVTEPKPTATPQPTEPPEIRATLLGAGDILMHLPVINGGLTKTEDGETIYQYDYIFAGITDIIRQADLAMANYEGTLAGPPYSGYPYFSAPDAIADAMVKAGFRVAWTANNHTIDKGVTGVVRTATVLQDKGLLTVGTRPDETKSSDAVVDLGGIQVGLMAYTFETLGTETVKALNGIAMPAAADPLVDSFNPYREAAFERDLQVMIDRSQALRADGAEVICLALHWGNEYWTKSADYQRSMAQQLCDAGIELIIGHHPHVIQEIAVLISADEKTRTLVYYSLGNLVSNQKFDTGNSQGNATDGLLARVTLLKKDGRVVVEKGEYIPLHVIKTEASGILQHIITPVLPALSDPAAYHTTKAELQASLERIRRILNQSTGDDHIVVGEADS